MLVPIDCSCRRIYCFPVSPIVATKMTEAVPTAMARAVNENCTLLLQNASYAKFRVSDRPSVRRPEVVSVGASQVGIYVLDVKPHSMTRAMKLVFSIRQPR